MSEWISVEDRLPIDEEDVLCYMPKRYGSKTDVAYLRLGLSKEERSAMVGSNDRKFIYKFGDEDGNNHVGYAWRGVGPMQYFGQEVTHWMPLPAPPK